MVRAIKAISQIPVETKYFPEQNLLSSIFSGAAYAGGPQATLRKNIFDSLPRIKNTFTKTEQSFIGDSISCRGLRWQLDIATDNPGLNSPDAQFRFTVYKESFYRPGYDGPGVTDPIFDQDAINTATIAMWNAQVTKIMFRRVFKIHQSG